MADLSVTATVENQTSGPLQEAADSFAAAAAAVVAANEKIAASSDEGGAAAAAVGEAFAQLGDRIKEHSEHLSGAEAIWHHFIETVHEDVVSGFSERIGQMLAEPVVELAKSVLEFPLEAYEKIKEVVLESAKAEREAAVAAQQLGTSVQFYTEMRFALSEGGAQAETFSKALYHLETLAYEGGPKWDAYGLSVRNASDEIKTGQELFLDAADYIASLKDPIEQAAAAAGLFGSKLGKEMIPALKEGREGLLEHAAEARHLGIAISDASAKIGSEFTLSMNKAKETEEGLARTAADLVEPALTKAFNGAAIVIGGMNRALQGTLEFLDKIPDKLSLLTSAIPGIGTMAQAFDLAKDALGFVADEEDKVAEGQDKIRESVAKTAGELKSEEAAFKETLKAAKEIADTAKWRIEADAHNAKAAEEKAHRDAAAMDKAMKDIEAFTHAEEYAMKVSDELDKEYADEAKKTVERSAETQIKSEHMIFEQYRKRLEEQNKDYKLTDEAQTKQEQQAEHLAKTIAGPLATSSATFLRDLLNGKNIMVDISAAAEHLVVSLAEAAIKAAAIAAIKGALGDGGDEEGGGGGGGGFGFMDIVKGGFSLAKLFASTGGVVEDGRIKHFAAGGILDGPGPRGVDSLLVNAAPGEAFLSEPTTNALRRELAVVGSGSFEGGGMVGASPAIGPGGGHTFVMNFSSSIPTSPVDVERALRYSLDPALRQMLNDGRLDFIRDKFARTQ